MGGVKEKWGLWTFFLALFCLRFPCCLLKNESFTSPLFYVKRNDTHDFTAPISVVTSLSSSFYLKMKRRGTCMWIPLLVFGGFFSRNIMAVWKVCVCLCARVCVQTPEKLVCPPELSTSCSNIFPSSASCSESKKSDSTSTILSRILSATLSPLLPEVSAWVENTFLSLTD